MMMDKDSYPEESNNEIEDKIFNGDLKPAINNFIWMYGKKDMTLEEAEMLSLYIYERMERPHNDKRRI